LKSATHVNAILKDKYRKLVDYEKKLHKLNLAGKTDSRIYYILLQAALFSGDGATLEEIASTLQKSSRTIDNRIKSYPQEHIIINKTHRAYRYMLRLDFLK
ncbi:MAG: Fic family protein, partial [Schwartzia sp.]|nr:Fic family protein [Schwartzia sp. (in: firmicutes)]